MRRREFIALLGGAAAFPVSSSAQEGNIPVVGILDNGVPGGIAGFRRGLQQMGYQEGQNIAYEIRSTEQYERLPTLLNQLLERSAKVIGAVGGPAAIAARKAATEVPVVFSVGGDPIALGLVDTLNRPGGKVTGATFFAAQVLPKLSGILLELLPAAKVFGIVANFTNPRTRVDIDGVRAALNNTAIDLQVFSATSKPELDTAFSAAKNENVEALIIQGDAFLLDSRSMIVEHSIRHRIPTIRSSTDYPETAGLLAYGTKMSESHRQAGIYIARILKGETPGGLPVIQPNRFDFVVNLRIARTLGLTIPPSLLARADEVIE